MYGGRFAPVQYYTPPVFINGFRPPGVYSNGQQLYGARYRQQQIPGGLKVTGTPNLQKPPQSATAVKPVEIEPAPLKIQQVAAGDKVASIRYQAQGDSLFRTGNYNRAFSAYKSAIEADPGRPAPYFRLANLFSALRTYDSAIRYLKQGLDLAPGFARDGDRLDAMYGPAGGNQKRTLISNVVAWAQQNAKSPDRQLLAGAMLHFDDQPATAAPFLERASQLSRRPARATAILSARDNDFIPPAPQAPGLLLQPEPEPETGQLPPPTLPISAEPDVPPTPPQLPIPNLDVPPDPIESKDD
jgi:tetratricopeptide (TPR) repeat protein